MKIVKVTYTTQTEFAEQNQSNIKIVMNDLQNLNYPGILYHVCLNPDGRTFVHTAFFKQEEDQKLLLDLPSFKNFQEQQKMSKPEVAPKQELVTLVGASGNIFRS